MTLTGMRPTPVVSTPGIALLAIHKAWIDAAVDETGRRLGLK